MQTDTSPIPVMRVLDRDAQSEQPPILTHSFEAPRAPPILNTLQDKEKLSACDSGRVSEGSPSKSQL